MEQNGRWNRSGRDFVVQIVRQVENRNSEGGELGA